MISWIINFLLGVSLFLTLCGSVEYYVIPSTRPNKACPQREPCYTLNEYALNYSTELSNRQENVSLLFLRGSHSLDYTLMITNMKQLSIGLANHQYSDILVTDVDFIIKNVSVLIIRSLIITGYSRSSFLQAPVVALTLAGHSVLIDHVTVHSSKIQLVGKKFEINYCNIYQSTIRVCSPKHKDHTELDIYKLFAHGTKITLFKEDKLCSSEVKLKINISTSILNRDYANKYAMLIMPVTTASEYIALRETNCRSECLQVPKLYRNTSIIIYISQSTIISTIMIHLKLSPHVLSNFGQTNIKVSITDSNISQEHWKFGSGLQVTVYNVPTYRYTVKILISNCTISGIHQPISAQFLPLYSPYIYSYEDSDKTLSNKSEVSIKIRQTTFINNYQPIDIVMDMEAELSCTTIITNCRFEGSSHTMDIKKAPNELVIPYGTQNKQTESTLTILLQNVTIKKCYKDNLRLAQVTIQNVDQLTIENCNITDNSSPAIQAYFSRIVLSGNVMFVNNSGDKGGAIGLYQSYLFLSNFSNIFFGGNSASDVGGGIFIQKFPIKTFAAELPQCFYQFNAHPKSLTVNVEFRNNKAINGGDDIFGGTIHGLCSTYQSSDPLNYGNFFNEIFHFFNSTLSSVSSEPTRVCLCDQEGTPQCANIKYMFATQQPRYPGELFTVPAVAVGYDFGTVTGLIYSHVLNNEANASIEEDQHIQQTKNLHCTLLNFSLAATEINTTVTIQLDVSLIVSVTSKTAVYQAIIDSEDFDYIDENLLHHPVQINIPLQDCPVGYILSTTPPYICKCHPKLEQAGITRCIISNSTGWVYRSGTVWVGASYINNITNGFVIHQYCPYGYCKPENTSVTLKLPDRQCALYHSGILCGGCRGNLSLALGSSKCLQCDNRYISLLLVFGLAGILLVLFIKLLNLTVSQGMTNGLVFYANIVWANKSILISNTELAHPAIHILHTFIAWVNLDLGIETCFISGLNAYWKIWLQFIFPIYIWSITGVMIISARYSTRASKLFGNNSVPVLATLILLSYAKLLRTIITSLGFSLLNYPEGARMVWSFDGNVPYFGAAHTILFLVSLATLLLLWLPYTIVLLTLQWLRRKSYIKPLRWINRWKPFFDAYFGQLKPKHHYWVGLLLLVRVFQFVLFAGTSAIAPGVNVMAIAIICTLLLAYTSLNGMVYRKWYLSFIENSFLVNLSVLAAGTLYLQAHDNPNSSVVYTVSIAIALLKFLGIIFYHIYDRIRESYKIYKRRHTNTAEVRSEDELKIVAGANHSRMHYREPLLDSSVQEN